MELKENLVDVKRSKFKRFKTILNVVDENPECNFNNLLECFSKKKKNLESVNFIKRYLKENMPKLVDSTSVSKLDENEILTYISLHLRLEVHPQNKVLMRIGEKGERYFIILKGQVEILVPKEIRIDLTYQEYSNYILALKSYYEYEVLYKCLIMNNSTFSFPEDFLVNLTSTGKKSVMKSSTLRRSFLKSSIENQNFFSELISFNKEASKLIINYKDYIENLTPKISLDDSSERRTTRIFEFSHIVTLKIGDGFGDLALSNSNSKRTATIITSSDTYLGVLDRHSYENCLKDIKDKEKKSLISFISMTPIFNSINKEAISKEYLNYFVEKKVKKKDKIISDGEEAKYLYIIKEGEYGVSVNKSINDIDAMINQFCGKPAEHKRISFGLTKSQAYKEYVSHKMKSKISILHEKDIIGFQNMVFEGKYCFEVECLSEIGSLIRLDSSILSLIYQTDKKILDDIEVFMSIKLPIINKRLNEIKLAKLDFFSDQEESRKLSIQQEKMVSKDLGNMKFTTFKSKSVNKNNSVATLNHSNPKIVRYNECKSTEGLKINREKDAENDIRQESFFDNPCSKEKDAKNLVGYSYLTIVSPKKNLQMNLSSTHVKIRTINQDLILRSSCQESQFNKEKYKKPRKKAHSLEHENSSISKDKNITTEIKYSTKCDAETLAQSLPKNLVTTSSSLYMNEVNHLDIFAYDKHYNKSPQKLPRLTKKSCENSLMNQRARLIYFSPSKISCLNVYMKNGINDKNEGVMKRLNSHSLNKQKKIKLKTKKIPGPAYN